MMKRRRERSAASQDGPRVVLTRATRLTVLDEPLQRDINVVLLLARDRVATDFAVLNS